MPKPNNEAAPVGQVRPQNYPSDLLARDHGDNPNPVRIASRTPPPRTEMPTAEIVPFRPARQKEIKRRHDRDKRAKQRKSTFGTIRVNELTRLFQWRYGFELSDDDAGREDAFVMVNALLWCPAAERRVPHWLSLWCPWMPADECAALMKRVFAKPIKWRADTIAKRMNLMDADRKRLGITTIGAVDLTKEQRAARRKEKDRLNKERTRREAGAKPQSESLSRTKPWEAEVPPISERTWHRRKANRSPADSLTTSAAPI
jgi:hypothetical protein